MLVRLRLANLSFNPVSGQDDFEFTIKMCCRLPADRTEAGQ
jgi:hypothetical protein